MNFDLVPRRYRVTDEQIDDGDFQAIVTPLWWEVSIYDGETEMYDSLDRFTDQQKYVWAIQWYYSEVENGGHDQFFYNDTGIVLGTCARRTPRNRLQHVCCYPGGSCAENRRVSIKGPRGTLA